MKKQIQTWIAEQIVRHNSKIANVNQYVDTEEWMGSFVVFTIMFPMLWLVGTLLCQDITFYIIGRTWMIFSAAYHFIIIR